MSTLEDNEDDDPPVQRKGRGNAILTYETVAGIDKKVTEVATKLEAVIERLGGRDEAHQDHEVRIRALEISQAAALSSQATRSTTWQTGVTFLLSVAAVIISLVNLLK